MQFLFFIVRIQKTSQIQFLIIKLGLTKVMNHKKVTIKNVFLIFCSFIVSIVLAEILLSVFNLPDLNYPYIKDIGAYRRFDSLHGIEPLPNVQYEEYGVTVKTSENATYGSTINIKKNGYRLAFLGDSYTVGPGIEFCDNYPSLILTEFKNKQKAKKVDMILGAIAGSSPCAQVVMLKNKIGKYNPDLIIYQLYDNDMYDDNLFLHSNYKIEIDKYKTVPELFFKFRTTKILIDGYYSAVSLINQKKNNSNIVEMHHYWDKYTAVCLEEIIHYAKKRDIPLVLLYISSACYLDKADYELSICENLPSMDCMEPWIIELSKKNNVELVNMVPVFNKINTEKLYELYLPAERGYHLNKYAADIVAKTIMNADTIKRELSLLQKSSK